MEENKPNFWADMTITKRTVSKVDQFVQVHIKGPMPWDDIILHYKQGSTNARVVDILEAAINDLKEGATDGGDNARRTLTHTDTDASDAPGPATTPTS